jgi:alkanesulfonate monooxygenase SsuD/methylene tetrahydromethanopterin reductase-like flavin-dependent oxidoreductase (luciferase family)
MSVTPRGIGVSVMPLDNRREVLVAAAVEADRLGYDAFLLPETWALDVPVVLAEAAVRLGGSCWAPASSASGGEARPRWP